MLTHLFRSAMASGPPKSSMEAAAKLNSSRRTSAPRSASPANCVKEVLVFLVGDVRELWTFLVALLVSLQDTQAAPWTRGQGAGRHTGSPTAVPRSMPAHTPHTLGMRIKVAASSRKPSPPPALHACCVHVSSPLSSTPFPQTCAHTPGHAHAHALFLALATCFPLQCAVPRACSMRAHPWDV